MKMKDRISKLEEIIKMQESPGNYDHDSYNFGFLNGLILAKAIITESDVVYKDKPKKFISSISLFKKFKARYGSKKA